MTQAPTLSKMPVQSLAQPTYEITEEDRARQKKIAQAWIAYHGELDPPLKKMENSPDDNVLSNRVKPPVQSGKGFLFGKELEISVDKGAPKEAQTFLDKVWGKKETRIPLLQKLAMNGAMAGCAFLRITPSTSKIRRNTKYRLIPVDPAIVSMKTAPQDCDTVLLYCLQYSTMEKINGVPKAVYYREEIQRIDPDGNASRGQPDDDDTWSIQHWTQISAKGAEPKLTGWRAEGPPIVWNYPFPPLFHCQNMILPNDPWGEPDVTPDLIGMNNALNLDLSDINRTEKIYGGPVLYATDTGDGTIVHEPGKIIKLPLSTSKIEAVHIASDVANALAFAGDLRSDMDELTRTPGVATGRISTMPRGNLSGIAIELLFQPELMKTEEKRCTYGELIIDVSVALLVLGGKSGDIEITLGWQNPLPHDDLPSVQAGISKKEIGISETTIQREQGYDPEEEFKIKLDEMKQKAQLLQAAQDALPPGLPGAPPLPNQPPPAPPVAPGAGTPPTAIGGKPA